MDSFKKEQYKQSSAPYCYCCNDNSWSNKKARRDLKNADSKEQLDEGSNIALQQFLTEQERLKQENDDNMESLFPLD